MNTRRVLRSRPALFGAAVATIVAMAVTLALFAGAGQRSSGGLLGSGGMIGGMNGQPSPEGAAVSAAVGDATPAGDTEPSSSPKSRESAPAYSSTPLQSASLAVAPTRVSITSAGIDAEVIPVGNDANGNMEIPSNGDIAGWYQRSVVPGRQGTSVITAHVDTRETGAGAFFELRRVRDGDVIDVFVGSEIQQWRVTGISQQPKEQLPRDILFNQHDRPLLALITCSGSFDRSARRYQDNLIVYAEPITSG